MFTTIRSKFIFLTIIIIVLGTTISNILITGQLRQNFNQQTILLLGTTLDVLKDGLYHEMMAGKKKNIQHIIDDLSNDKSIDFIRIINHNGIVKYASNKEEINMQVANVENGSPEILEINTRTIKPSFDNFIFSASEPIINEARCQSCHKNNIIAFMDVKTNFKDAESKFYVGTTDLLLLSALIVVLLIVAFYFLYNFLINSPLKKFILALDGVKDGDMNIVLPKRKEDEIGLLYTRFNNMISKLKESKEKIEELHTDQLQRADRLVTLGELTAEMAHEINNHSGIIMSRADYLQLESMNNKDLKKYSKDLDTILQQTDNVSKITGKILKHSKKPAKTKQNINLIEIIDESLNMLKPAIRKKNVEIIKNYDIDKAIIFADQLEIEQAFTNLITNAMDAIDDKGEIEIFISKDKSYNIKLMVKDNGEGIKASIVDQIFLPFFTTKDTDKGTGLGLYIIKKICDNNFAKIDCESQTGKGTTFTITFNGAEK